MDCFLVGPQHAVDRQPAGLPAHAGAIHLRDPAGRDRLPPGRQQDRLRAGLAQVVARRPAPRLLRDPARHDVGRAAARAARQRHLADRLGRRRHGPRPRRAHVGPLAQDVPPVPRAGQHRVRHQGRRPGRPAHHGRDGRRAGRHPVAVVVARRDAGRLPKEPVPAGAAHRVAPVRPGPDVRVSLHRRVPRAVEPGRPRLLAEAGRQLVSGVCEPGRD